MDKFMKANQAMWNAWTPHHVRSAFYDVEGFKVGRHRMADIINALARAGLRITSFEEYPYVAWPMFPWMEQRADGAWQFPGGAGHIPLMFSLTATQ